MARLVTLQPEGGVTEWCGHVGWWGWVNGAELVWECTDACPHPDHDEEA